MNLTLTLTKGKMLVGEGKFKMCKTDYYYFMYHCTCMMITFYKWKLTLYPVHVQLYVPPYMYMYDIPVHVYYGITSMYFSCDLGFFCTHNTFQGCALAEPGGPWCLNFPFGWLENRSVFLQIIVLGTLDFTGSDHWAPSNFS